MIPTSESMTASVTSMPESDAQTSRGSDATSTAENSASRAIAGDRPHQHVHEVDGQPEEQNAEHLRREHGVAR